MGRKKYRLKQFGLGWIIVKTAEVGFAVIGIWFIMCGAMCL